MTERRVHTYGLKRRQASHAARGCMRQEGCSESARKVMGYRAIRRSDIQLLTSAESCYIQCSGAELLVPISTSDPAKRCASFRKKLSVQDQVSMLKGPILPATRERYSLQNATWNASESEVFGIEGFYTTVMAVMPRDGSLGGRSIQYIPIQQAFMQSAIGERN